MKKLILLIALPLASCGGGTAPSDIPGGTRVSDENRSCTVFIIEKDGHKFAVAVGLNKCAITQIR
jgi:hypothetical protein